MRKMRYDSFIDDGELRDIKNTRYKREVFQVQNFLSSLVPNPKRLGNPDEYGALVQHIIQVRTLTVFSERMGDRSKINILNLELVHQW